MQPFSLQADTERCGILQTIRNWQKSQLIFRKRGCSRCGLSRTCGVDQCKIEQRKIFGGRKENQRFTNEEETAVKLENVVPFLLESKLIERGAKFEKSGLWQSHVIVDQRVVTGQNPQSAKGVGEVILTELKKLN